MDDKMIIYIEVSDPSLIKELQIGLDIEAATNDFERNYHFMPGEPPQSIPRGAIS